MLQGRAVEDEVDALHRPVEPVTIADVADQEAEIPSSGVPLALVELLGLVAPEDTDDTGVELEQAVDEAGADRARTAGHEHATVRQPVEGVDGRASCRGQRGAPSGVTGLDAVRRVPRPESPGRGPHGERYMTSPASEAAAHAGRQDEREHDH